MINTKDLLIETNFTNRDIKSFEFINWSNESFFLLKRLNWKKHKEVDATVERDGTIETGQDEPILLIDFRRIASARHFPRFSFIRLASQT